MHRYFCALAIFLFVATAGCATSSQNNDGTTVAKKDNGSRVTCKREMVVGSHVPRTVCREQRAAEQDSERDREMLRRQQQQNIRVIPGAN